MLTYNKAKTAEPTTVTQAVSNHSTMTNGWGGGGAANLERKFPTATATTTPARETRIEDGARCGEWAGASTR